MKIKTIKDLEYVFLCQKGVKSVRTLEYLEEPAIVLCIQPYFWRKFWMIFSSEYKKKYLLKMQSIVRNQIPDIVKEINVEVIIEL